MIYKSTIYLSGIILLLLLIQSCNKERQVPVPYVYVNYTVYLNNPSNNNLRVPNGYLLIPDQGNMGIILYRRSDTVESDDFVAFDLTCTYEVQNPDSLQRTCKLKVDNTGFYLECPCCGSKFTIWDGLVASGPARWSLKEYTTSLTISQVRIYN